MNEISLAENKLLDLESEITVSKFGKTSFKKPDLYDQFNLIDQATYTKAHKARFNQDPAVEHLNRYTDILPCKYTVIQTYCLTTYFIRHFL